MSDRSGLLDKQWFAPLLALLVAIPVLIPSFPPLIDIGGHLGRYVVQNDGGSSGILRQWYSFDWALLPNLGSDLLVAILAPAIGLELSVKLVVAAGVSAWAAGILLVSRAAHGRLQPTALFALPLIYGLPFQFGFTNFHLSVGLALLALALWLWLSDRGAWQLRIIAFIPIGFMLWLCHLVGWGVFGVMAFGDGLARERNNGHAFVAAAFRSGIATLPLLAGPIAGAIFGPAGAPENAFIYAADASPKLIWLILALTDRWYSWDQASIGLLMAGLSWFWVAGRFSRHRGLTYGALILVVIYLAMPGVVMDSAFADMRLAPVVITILLLAVRIKHVESVVLRRVLILAGLSFAGARLAGNAVSMVGWDHDARRTLSVLDAVPVGSNLITFVALPCDQPETWLMNRRVHLSGFALARRMAFDNQQWQMPSGQLLRVHNPAARPFDYDKPKVRITDKVCGNDIPLAKAFAALGPDINRVWVVGVPKEFESAGWDVVRQSGDSAVFRREPRDN